MSSLHTRAIVIAVVHYLLSFGVFLLAMSEEGKEGLGLDGFILVVLQAPVALIQWLAIHASANGKEGLQGLLIVLLAMPSSLLYGYVIAFLFRRKPSHHDNSAA